MKINEKQFPYAEEKFIADLAAYRAARDAHKLTVGVPAPFPPHEIMRVIVDSGEPLVIERDPKPVPFTPTPSQAKAMNLSMKRMAALQVLDDARLAAAALDPLAPQAVKDYAAAKAAP